MVVFGSSRLGESGEGEGGGLFLIVVCALVMIHCQQTPATSKRVAMHYAHCLSSLKTRVAGGTIHPKLTHLLLGRWLLFDRRTTDVLLGVLQVYPADAIIAADNITSPPPRGCHDGRLHQLGARREGAQPGRAKQRGRAK